MKLSKSLAVLALICYAQSTLTMKQLPEHELSIETPPARYSIELLYNNAVIGSAMYQDQDNGTRRIGVFLNEPYHNKNIDPYFEELLQKKVNQGRLPQLRMAIKDIKPDKLALGNRVVSSGSMRLLKNGKNIMSVTYSDNQDQGGLTREIGTSITEEQFRNQGYGSYLMQSFIEKARKDNVLMIKLKSTPDAIPFYTRLGFIRQDQKSEPAMLLKLK